MVHRLTYKYESGTPHPWSMEEAPPEFINHQIMQIIGIELEIFRVEAKAKLSQNRNVVDIGGAIKGLNENGNEAVAALIETINMKRHQ